MSSPYLGGLVVVNPVDVADSQFTEFIKTTPSLRSLIVAPTLKGPLLDVSLEFTQDLELPQLDQIFHYHLKEI